MILPVQLRASLLGRKTGPLMPAHLPGVLRLHQISFMYLVRHSYLTELLLAKGYTVHGLIRRASTFHTERIEHVWRSESHASLHLLFAEPVEG
jgi:hypothetical protein